MVAKAAVPTTSQGDLSDLSLLKMPTARETPHRPLRKSSIPSPWRSIVCATAHFEELRGARKPQWNSSGRRGAGRWLEKIHPRSYGQGSAVAGAPGCEDTPTADFDISALVPTRYIM